MENKYEWYETKEKYSWKNMLFEWLKIEEEKEVQSCLKELEGEQESSLEKWILRS